MSHRCSKLLVADGCYTNHKHSSRDEVGPTLSESRMPRNLTPFGSLIAVAKLLQIKRGALALWVHEVKLWGAYIMKN